MGLWDIAGKVIDVAIDVYGNYQNNQKINESQRREQIRQYSNNPPKLLDNYYYGMTIKDIENENGIYAINDKTIDFQYARDEYFFCRNTFGQLFYFQNNRLSQIKLITDWDGDCYNNIVTTIGQTCSIIYGESDKTIIDVFNAIENDIIEDMDDFKNVITNIEEEGLKNDELIFLYIDNWVGDFLSASKVNPQNKDDIISKMPNNSRLIQVQVDKHSIYIDFIHPFIVRNSSF